MSNAVREGKATQYRMIDAVHSGEEREVMLQAMKASAHDFYMKAVKIGCHPWIEFTGILNEYIKLCQEAHAKGMDFTVANHHSGITLPAPEHSLDYIAEKLGCIFGGTLQVGRPPSDPEPTRALSMGDRVTWSSQAGGVEKVKQGVVVAVIPARTSPKKCLPAGCKVDPGAISRDHESYLVQVGRSARLYWPRVSALKPDRI